MLLQGQIGYSKGRMGWWLQKSSRNAIDSSTLMTVPINIELNHSHQNIHKRQEHMQFKNLNGSHVYICLHPPKQKTNIEAGEGPLIPDLETISFRWTSPYFWWTTLQGTNISPINLKMIFLFPRWDMWSFPGGFFALIRQHELLLVTVDAAQLIRVL